MWVISVEPIPSRISTPKRSRKRDEELGGQRLARGNRLAERTRTSCRGDRRRAAPRRRWGRRRRASAGGARMRPATSAGVGGRVGSRIACAPAASGKVSELPKPYAWNIGATERCRSLGLRPRAPRSRSPRTSCACRRGGAWPASVRPVVPDVQSQKHGDSAVVASMLRYRRPPRARPSRSAPASPAVSASAADVNRRRRGPARRRRAPPARAPASPGTTAQRAREFAAIATRSRAGSSGLTGSATAPIRIAARMPVASSGPSRRTSSTRSSRRTRAAANRPRRDSTESSSSAYVMRASPDTTAMRSPAPPSTFRSTQPRGGVEALSHHRAPCSTPHPPTAPARRWRSVPARRDEDRAWSCPPTSVVHRGSPRRSVSACSAWRQVIVRAVDGEHRAADRGELVDDAPARPLQVTSRARASDRQHRPSPARGRGARLRCIDSGHSDGGPMRRSVATVTASPRTCTAITATLRTRSGAARGEQQCDRAAIAVPDEVHALVTALAGASR